jgi:NTP pyrophosphatase (non-canonical NTP hydrolase)|tara:strand:- start:1275 stop:1679 length:405 start_codon:yes stop_codon:yes gene_type:complete
MTSNFDSKYVKFVNQVTSDESKNHVAFINRIRDLEETSEMHRLLTAAVGMSAEGGEFLEIVKKMIFQGKPYNEDNVRHLKIELGDILWYVAQACMALDISLDEITDMNIDKLSKRFPDGHFSEYYSENRKEDDL